MATDPITIRIDKEDMRIFKNEAAKQGKNVRDYLRDLIRHGYFYRGLRDVVEEVKSIRPELEHERKAHFEALFEIRNYLRLMALKENQEHVATAKSKAVETAVQLLKGE